MARSESIRKRRSWRGPTRRGYVAKVVVLGLVVAGVGGYLYTSTQPKPVVMEEELFHQAKRGPFVHDVVERGEVQSGRNVEVVSEVRSYRSTTSFDIIWVIEEGSVVEEGDVLVRLDSSSLEEEEKIQRLDVAQAVAALSKAENQLEAAEIAMKEYVNGLFIQEKQKAEAEITLAKETLRRAEEYFAYSSRLAAKGYVTSLQLEGDRFAVEKARIELEVAQKTLDVLVEHTRHKRIKELESNIGVAKAELEKAREQCSIEQKMLSFFTEQIENCTIRAPSSGQVVYANERGSRESSEFIVEAGAKVRERQPLVRLPDYSSMQISCLINESRVSLVEVGMSTTITLDAFEGMQLQGKVIRVNEYPEPISRYGPQVKRYAAVVEISDPPRTIKPGLTAQVAIRVAEQDDALQVPVQAVYQHGEDFYCMVQAPTEIQPRKVDVGANNSRFVVINSGLSENEFVSMTPRHLLDQVDLPELPEDSGAGKKGNRSGTGRPDKSPGSTVESPSAEDDRQPPGELKVADNQSPQSSGGAE